MEFKNFIGIKKMYIEASNYDEYEEEFSNIAIDGLNDFISRYFTASKYFLVKNNIELDKNIDDLFLKLFFEGTLCETSIEIFNEEGKIFISWYLNKGYNYIKDLLFNINSDNLDTRLYSFVEYYDFSLRDAIEEDDIEVLADWLYKIPGVMKEEFEKFGFLLKSEEKNKYEEYELYIPNDRRRIKTIFYYDEDLGDNCSMKPDVNQALIA